MNVLTLAATLTLNKTQYDRGLQSAKKDASTVGRGISGAFSSTGSKLEAIGGAFSNLGTKLGNISTKFGTLSKKTMELSRKFAPLSAAAAAVFIPAVKSASTYQDKIAKVSTLVDTSKTPVSKLSKMFLDLSNNTGKSASELAEAGYQALSSGVSVEKLGKFTKTAANLAKVGFTETSTAVNVLTTAQNAYGKSAGSADEIANKLVKTQNLGKTTVGELANSMGRVIPNAANLGVNISNLSAAYVSLTKQGINTRISTTYINAMLQELGKSGSNVSEILRAKTGKSFKELMDSGMPLSEVLKILKEEAEKNGTNFKELWSSSSAGTGALALLSQGGKDFDNALKELDSDTDAVSEALKKLGGTAGAKMRKALTNLQNAGISLGIAFLQSAAPAINKFAGWITKLSEKIQQMDPKTKTMIMTILGIVAAVTPVLVALAGFFKILSSVFGVLSLVAKGVGLLISGIGFLFSPLGLIVVAIGAVIAIGVLLYKNWDTVKKYAVTLMKNLKVSFTQIGQAIVTAWNAIKKATLNVWNTIKSYVIGVVNKVRTMIQTAFNAIKTVIQNVWNTVRNATSTAWNAIKTVISGVANAVRNTIRNAWNAIKTLTSTVWNAIKTAISNALTAAKTVVSNAVSAIKNVMHFSGLSGIVSSVFNAVKTTIHNVISNVKSFVGNAVNNIKSHLKFSGIAGTVKGVFNSVYKAITSPVSNALTKVKGIVAKIKSSFNNFKLKLPTPKLPKISLTTASKTILGKKITYPTGFSISWNKKAMNNLIGLDGATIFGAAGGNLLGGGEAGREYVVGEQYALNMIRKATRNTNVEAMLARLLNLLEAWLPQKTVAYINRRDIDRELGMMMP